MRKIIALIISCMIVITGISTAHGAESGREYADVKPTHWAYEAVKAMSDRAVITGYPDGNFLPDNTVTYGEFIKMALIADTGEDVGNAVSGHWASNYYDKALERGYFTEYDIDRSYLSNKIPRAHMALIISSILGDLDIGNYDETQKGITDITYQTKYEYDITKAYASGILTGYTDDTFRPDKTLSRAEAAIVIYRLVDESKRVLPEMATENGGGNSVETLKPIEEVITNIDSFYNPGNGSLNEDLAAADTYEIETDGDKYGMTLHENRGTKWIELPPAAEKELGQIFLMKDGKIVEFTAQSPRKAEDGSIYAVAGYFSDITQIDYIVSLYIAQDGNNEILMIENPFKK